MRVFVLGHKGMLGRYVYTYLKSKKYDVIGVSRPVIDAAKMTKAKLKAAGLHKGDVVINCIGTIKRKDATKVDYALVNSAFPHLLAAACEDIGAKLIHITTDCVYDGMEGMYDESHEHTARDVYGMSKSVGEPENVTVVRTSIIGEEVGQARSLVEWIKSNKGKKVNGFTNHLWNGITCLQFAKVCEEIIERNLFWRGVKHIVSPYPINKADLVKMVSDTYDLGIEVTPMETGQKCDRTLSSTRTDVMFAIPPLHDQVVEMKVFSKKLHKEKI
jgi:dTDP-4-dehydrorhamnose reductase